MPMPEVGWERDADAYLFDLATLSGEVGAIDEPLGGYRSHGGNVSAMVKKGKVNKTGLGKFLQREILTDQSLAAYGQTIGVHYRLGTLTNSLPHQQQLFLYEKLFGDKCGPGRKSAFQIFILYMKLLLQASWLPLYKKPIIAAWSLVGIVITKVVGPTLSRDGIPIWIGVGHQKRLLSSLSAQSASPTANVCSGKSS